jgi:hypothetical protein
MMHHCTTSPQEAQQHLGLEPIIPPVPEPVDTDLESGLNVFKTLTNISQVSNTLLKRALAEQNAQLTLHVMDAPDPITTAGWQPRETCTWYEVYHIPIGESAKGWTWEYSDGHGHDFTVTL